MLHYHIRWSGGKLDWEAFENQAAAKEAAERLVRPNETYAIQSFNGDCPLCPAAAKQRLATRA